MLLVSFPRARCYFFIFKFFNAEWRASSAPFAEVNNLLYDFFLLSLLGSYNKKALLLFISRSATRNDLPTFFLLIHMQSRARFARRAQNSAND